MRASIMNAMDVIRFMISGWHATEEPGMLDVEPDWQVDLTLKLEIVNKC